MSTIPRPHTSPLRLTIASDEDRAAIYAIRHCVYADELRQHPPNAECRLTDALDVVNQYIVAKINGDVIGFVSITPPSAGLFSVDKYVDRRVIPYPFDDRLYEIRLLTVVRAYRTSQAALALMYAAFRWVQAHGGQHIVAIGRRELMSMYTRAGLRSLNIVVPSGAVQYEVAVADIANFGQIARENKSVYDALAAKVDWQLPYAYTPPTACYHGGQFFNAVGEDLQTLHKAADVINADVLDAWFPPSPAVLNVLQENLAWLVQTSPPTTAAGFIRAVARARGVGEACVLPGAGSSDLIFLALRHFLRAQQRVLLLDPCYGEYAHVLEQVIGCSVTRFTLRREDGFVVDTDALLTEMQRGYAIVVLVNPNSPTGRHIPRQALTELLQRVPPTTLVWIDETYIDYVDAAESLESFATKSENVIVCKSMSKAYSLSGVRVAYLCGPPHLLESLKSLTPPWAVSLPAQAAAIAALSDPDYYREKYLQTHVLRAFLKQQLLALGMAEVIDGVANFLLVYLPDYVASAVKFVAGCQRKNLFLRDVGSMGQNLGDKVLRVAVKDKATTRRMLTILTDELNRYQC